MRLSYNPPVLVKKIFNDYYWQTSNNKILLTFDDGPTETTTIKILDMLGNNNLRAMFFCIGSNVNKYSDLAEKIINDGHTIANHTMNHTILTKVNRKIVLNEIRELNNILSNKFGYQVNYIRPPHGKFNFKSNSLFRESNLRCVMWSLLTYDYKNDLNKVKFAIDNYLRKDSIVVFHDNAKCSDIIVESINYIIESAAKRGYEIGEPSECLK